jgi:hypothetical protein
MCDRVEELQGRMIVKLLTEGEVGMPAQWMSDALCDSTSPMRRLMEWNSAWRAVYEDWGRPPCGKMIRKLWTPGEVAAVAFQRAIDRPWASVAVNEDPWGRVRGRVIREKVMEEWREERNQRRMVLDVQEGRNKLARDIPMPEGRTPLKKLDLKVADRRRVLGWWLGSFPRSGSGETCGVCATVFNGGGKREHAAACVQVVSGELLVEEERIEASYPAAELRNRDSRDKVSRCLWAALAGGVLARNNERGERALKALEDICGIVLWRNRDRQPT